VWWAVVVMQGVKIGQKYRGFWQKIPLKNSCKKIKKIYFFFIKMFDNPLHYVVS